MKHTNTPPLADTPLILVLPGNGTIDKPLCNNKNRFLSGTANFAARDGYNVISAAYASNAETTQTILHYMDGTMGARPQGYSWSKDTQDLIDHLIRPNVPDMHDCTNEDRATRLMACFRTFRNIKIFSNSYGGLVTRQINNGLNSLMDIKGYTDEEKSFLIPQITTMGVATICHAEAESRSDIPQMTSVTLKALNDERLYDMYSAFGKRELALEYQLSPEKPHGFLQFGPNQIGFYAAHNPQKVNLSSPAYSHHITSYLPDNDRENPFCIVYDTFWDAITTQNATWCLHQTGLSSTTPPSEQWTRVQARFDQPIISLINHAQQSPDFTALVDCSLDDGPIIPYIRERKQAPTPFAAEINKGPRKKDLAQEMNRDQPKAEMAEYLLRGQFEPFGQDKYRIGIPSKWANEQNADHLTELSMMLFHTKSEGAYSGWYGRDEVSGTHDILRLNWRGVSYPRYLVVDAKVYDTIIQPFQHQWRNNDDQEDIMSIRRRIYAQSQLPQAQQPSPAALPKPL